MEQQPDLKRTRATFNLVTLHLAGFSYDQIELLRPSDLTEDGLHDLLIKQLNEILRKWAAEHHLKIKPTSKTKRKQTNHS
jgi:hypothetical protein